MKAEINADIPFQLDSASELLADLVEFEDKMTQAVAEMEQLEQAHGVSIEFATTTRDGADGDDVDILEIRLVEADVNTTTDPDTDDESDS
jgi:hypothetical protein